ncbi:hypothetical protein ACOSP7_007140 [Xanthoceras sorbifolium]
MKEYQTPQKEHSRLSNRRSKESQSKNTNVTKKSLNAAFKGLSVEFSPEITKEQVDFSPISEISDANCNSEIAQSLELALDPSLSVSSEPFLFSDLSASSIITVCKDELSDISPDHHRFDRSDGSKFGSAEADVAVSYLKRALYQVLKSVDTDSSSKKLLDTLITIVVDELTAAPAKRDDCFTKLILMKKRVVFACFLIWILAVIGIFFLSSGSRRPYIGPLPT